MYPSETYYSDMYPCNPCYGMQRHYGYHMPYAGMEMTDATTYIKCLLMNLMGKCVDILIDGRESFLKNLMVVKVEDGVVITQRDKEMCVIAIEDISAVCIPKDVSKHLYNY